MADINRRLLLTQTGVTRLIARLEDRGLVERLPHADDRRAARIVLMPRGAEAQKTVGRRHARSVADAMTGALSRAQLRDICRQIATVIEPGSSENTLTERKPT